MRIAVYARVSTKNHGQDTDTQLLPLRQYAAARGLDIAQEYVDNGFSGSKDRRPQLDRLMKDAHQRRFDAVLVFKLDRFGRSTSHLIRSLETFQSLGVGFISLTECLDSTTRPREADVHDAVGFCRVRAEHDRGAHQLRP